jgi:FkbM family methyltransferase
VVVTLNHAPLQRVTLTLENRTVEALLRADTSTMLVLQEVAQKQAYQPLTGVPEPRAILDVGGNQGVTAAYFRLMFPQSRIVSIEPDPATFPILAENARRLGQCDAINLALLDRNGKAAFKSSKISVLSTLYDLPHAGIANELVSVDLRHSGEFMDETLQAMGIDRFDMLKIDTEGAEVPILQAMGHRLSEITTIFLEYHSMADRAAIESMLAPSHELKREQLDTPELGSLTFLRRAV